MGGHTQGGDIYEDGTLGDGTHMEKGHTRRRDTHGEGTQTEREHTRRGETHGEWTHTDRRLHGEGKRDTNGMKIIGRGDYLKVRMVGKKTTRTGDYMESVHIWRRDYTKGNRRQGEEGGSIRRSELHREGGGGMLRLIQRCIQIRTQKLTQTRRNILGKNCYLENIYTERKHIQIEGDEKIYTYTCRGVDIHTQR